MSHCTTAFDSALSLCFRPSIQQISLRFYAKPGKKWYSRTYVPKYNWAVETLKQNEINRALTPKNQAFIQQSALELPKHITSPLIEEPWPRTVWRPNSKKLYRYVDPDCIRRLATKSDLHIL